MNFKKFAAILVCSASSVFAQSQSINFGSGLGVGLESDNSPWVSGSFFFQVGTFTTGFTPSAGNVNDWVSNWTVAAQGGTTGTTAWIDDGGDLSFSGAAAITSLTAPFTPGKQIYIWGYDSKSNGNNEWLLLQAVSWAVESNIDTPKSSNFLTTDSGVTAVIGSRTTPSGVETFKSALVTIGAPIPEPSSYAALAGLGILGFAASRRRRAA